MREVAFEKQLEALRAKLELLGLVDALDVLKRAGVIQVARERASAVKEGLLRRGQMSHCDDGSGQNQIFDTCAADDEGHFGLLLFFNFID